jgi:hypothetical protein
MKRTKKDLLKDVQNVKTAKFINNNTLKIEYLDGTTAIRLHDTDIITFAGKDIILNSGGWKTRTTKERINEYSPANISQNKSLWYIKDKLFYDGCKVNQTGDMISKPIRINENKLNKLKKQITKYCNLVTKDNLPLPDSGDCWDCSFKTKDGKTMGELSGSDHLLSHLKENYLHGSILVNAMRESGYNDTQIGLHYQMKWNDYFKRALRKYLTKRLINNFIK